MDRGDLAAVHAGPATAKTARLRPTARVRPHPSASGGSAASPSPQATPAGRAAFGGTWAGTVSQPGWSVPSWTMQLTIPASARRGSYDSPSTSCTGSVSVQSSSGSALTALALTGPGQLSMTWAPAGLRNELGTAVLTRS